MCVFVSVYLSAAAFVAAAAAAVSPLVKGKHTQLSALLAFFMHQQQQSSVGSRARCLVRSF